MSSQSENGVAPSEAPSTTGEGASAEPRDPPRSRKRRRKRSRKPSAQRSEPTAAEPSPQGSGGSATLANLAGGLLSHIDEREVPCASEGCDNVWKWSAEEQIRAYGQPPPRRLCDSCQELGDTEVTCAVDSCKRTWVWSREAQLKHRAWLKRNSDGGASGGGAKRGRKRRQEGPPRRKCDLCQAKSGTLAERASVCKVHGCTREVVIDRESQLKAWAALGTTDLEAEFALPKRMCDVCREFCRNHPDREVSCGNPGCEKTWTYKTGAQLQAFLAGRLEDPVRLCADCSAEQSKAIAHDDDVEVMPCVVPACDGVWHWKPGLKIAEARDGETPVDRMCDEHRTARGLPPRQGDDTDDASHAESASVQDAKARSDRASAAHASVVVEDVSSTPMS